MLIVFSCSSHLIFIGRELNCLRITINLIDNDQMYSYRVPEFDVPIWHSRYVQLKHVFDSESVFFETDINQV